MARLKFKEIKKMTEAEREKKFGELKFELVKSRAGASKKGSANPKQIKRMIAKIITANKQSSEHKVQATVKPK